MFKSETPPSPANIHVATPPDSANPTTAMLKADIDSGRTGDKVEHYDVGLSPLGTDDEAAGTPPSAERIALARRTEAASPQVRAMSDVHGERKWVAPAFFGVIVTIGAIMSAALLLGR